MIKKCAQNQRKLSSPDPNPPHPPSVVAPHQGKCPGRNTSAQAAAMAVNIGNNKIIIKICLTALADAANGQSMPCHEQRAGAFIIIIIIVVVVVVVVLVVVVVFII